MLWNAPNSLTLLRIVLIPLFVLVYYLPFRGANETAAVIFIVAALTDWLDGYLARRLKQHSPFGAFLDPVADKLMVAAALVMLAADPHIYNDPRMYNSVIDARLFAVVVLVIPRSFKRFGTRSARRPASITPTSLWSMTTEKPTRKVQKARMGRS